MAAFVTCITLIVVVTCAFDTVFAVTAKAGPGRGGEAEAQTIRERHMTLCIVGLEGVDEDEHQASQPSFVLPHFGHCAISRNRSGSLMSGPCSASSRAVRSPHPCDDITPG